MSPREARPEQNADKITTETAVPRELKAQGHPRGAPTAKQAAGVDRTCLALLVSYLLRCSGSANGAA